MRSPFTLLTIILLFSSGAFGQNPLETLLSLENLKKAERQGVDVVPGPKPNTITLKFRPCDVPEPFATPPCGIVLPVPPAASDWTKYGALTFHFCSDSTIRYFLDICDRKGQVFRYRVHPFTNVPVKAVIAGSYLTREYMNAKQYKGYWLSNWGNHIDMTQVESVSIRMAANTDVTLQFGPIALTKEVEPDEIYVDKPLVDAFGQWISIDWPGKIHSQEELKRAWAADDRDLQRSTQDFGYSRYGGYKSRKEKTTGFFHTAQVDGRWWLVDPDGYLFFSVGPNGVGVRGETLVAGREKIFAKLPPGTGDRVDFYRINALLRYGEAEFDQHWQAKAEQRLRAWGFNTTSRPMMGKPALPFATQTRMGSRFARNWQRYPDAYSEEFVRAVEEEARQQCEPLRNEPYLIGYFIGNEVRWPYRNLIDLILADTSPSATQSFVRRFLKDKGDNPAARDLLMETLSRRYFKVICDAMRKADPNHLILGIRWVGNWPTPDAVLRACDVFDVTSYQPYAFEPPADTVANMSNLARKPVMITEFHHGAVDRGYAPGLVMVKDQTERGAAYQYYVERAAALPFVVGAHYFQFIDQAVTGRMDGENYNIGLITQQDLPYKEMVPFLKATHSRLYAVHSGQTKPTDRRPKVR